MPLLFPVYPAPRYAFRRGMRISIPDSPIAITGALPTWVLQALAWDSSKGLPPVLLQVVERQRTELAVRGGQAGKASE
jgi:hypothetical protein